MKKRNVKRKKTVIAVRKSCEAKGTGLSHYVMPEPRKK